MNLIKKFCVFVFMLMFFLSCGFGSGVFSVYASDYNNIMKKANELNPHFGSSKIYDIALLASHDALSYNIDENSPVNPYNNSIPAVIGDLECAKKIIARYAKAQADPIGKQLQCGVRYIDARITCVNGIYYTYHSVLSTKLSECLKETINFLIDNPGEFIVFDIASYKTKEKNENDLAEYIGSIKVFRDGKGYNLYEFINYDTSKDFADVTYSDVTNSGKKAGVVIVADSFTDTGTGAIKVTNPSYSGFFKCKEKHATWHNKPSSSEVLDEIDTVANDYFSHKYGGFRCNQVQTSPDVATVIKAVADSDSSLLNDAKKHDSAVVNHSHFDYWMSVMPVIWFDYVTNNEGDFNKRINEKILEYNINLNNNSGSTAVYNQITSKEQLKDGMKIFLRESFTSNAFLGNSLNSVNIGEFKASLFNFKKYPADQFWTLIKSGDKWKIQLSDGTYLKRKGNCFSSYAEATGSKSSSTDFIINFYDDGNVKIYEQAVPKYGLNVKKSKLKLTDGRYTEFTLYTPPVA